ncbi:MAG TPA: hypothetical protein VFO62_12725, partial [Candidatus Binatia bacterium]|nr:hypothetical protein [Candidatus Binatia bacterium]
MGKFGLVTPDIMSMPGVLIAASSEASSSLEAQNLANGELWRKWRSGSLQNPDYTLQGNFTKSPTMKIDAVAIAGASLLRGNAEVCCF